MQRVSWEKPFDVGELVAVAFPVEGVSVDNSAAILSGQFLEQQDIDALRLEEPFDCLAFLNPFPLIPEASAVELRDPEPRSSITH